MNLFFEAKQILDKDGKVNPLGPYGKQKLTGREISTYFRRNKVKDATIKKAVEVALDLGGADTIARKEIKKFYGDKVLKSKEVQNALRHANESFTYNQSLNQISEENLNEKNLMPDIQKIVDTKGAKKVGGIMVDMFTASMINQIYNKVNDSNKNKMEKSNISTLVDIAQRMMQKNSVEEGANPAQQAAIAISKKEKAGKPGYDKEGKSLKKESIMDTYRKMWEDAADIVEVNESKDVRKKYRGKEQKSVDKLIMQKGVDKVQQFHDKNSKEFDKMVKNLAMMEEVANITVDPKNRISKPADQNKHALEINKQAKRFGLKSSMMGKHVRVKGGKKAVNDFLRIVIGKSSYGDPTEKDTSTPQIDKMLTKGLKEEVTEALSKIKRGSKLQKKDISNVEDHIMKSYLDKRVKDKIAFDDDAIYLQRSGKTIMTSRDYVGKMDIDTLIKTLEKKVN